MKPKVLVVAFLIAGLLASSVRKSEAVVLPTPPPPAGGTTVGAGAYIAGGIIGVAAVLCLYDIALKINGKKNWDGSPKTGPQNLSGTQGILLLEYTKDQIQQTISNLTSSIEAAKKLERKTKRALENNH